MAQSASPAQALLDNSFVISGGVFIVNSDLKASLNGQSSTNPEINFDDTFGTASDTTRGRIDMLWRINPKHHLRFMYFNNSVTRNKVLDRDVAWGDYTFKANGNVESRQKTQVYELAYEYAFMRAPTYEVAASIGLHALDMSIQLSGNATVVDAQGNASSASFQSKKADLLAPLPVIGLRGAWAVSPSWMLDAQAQLFNINANGYGGSWSDVRLGATWMFSKSFGVGLSYNRFTTRLDAEKNSFNGQVKLGYSGLMANLTGTF